jgi:hypothetical protein
VPVFVAEGKPAPAIQFTLTGTTVGPVRKLLALRAVTRELNEATPDTAKAVIGRILADRSNARGLRHRRRRRGKPTRPALRRDANPVSEHG